ncbi:MAG: hypothetical protein ACFFAN_10455 [Promethearchaeota archaeon]
MPTTNPIGYCLNCKQNVLLIRKRLDPLIGIILFCCTFGISFFIFLIIHYSKPENRCIHCGTICTVLPNQYIQKSSQLLYQQQTQDYQSTSHPQYNKPYIQVERVEGEKANYCPLCGAKLDNRNKKFCSNCGNEI